MRYVKSILAGRSARSRAVIQEYPAPKSERFTLWFGVPAVNAEGKISGLQSTEPLIFDSNSGVCRRAKRFDQKGIIKWLQNFWF